MNRVGMPKRPMALEQVINPLDCDGLDRSRDFAPDLPDGDLFPVNDEEQGSTESTVFADNLERLPPLAIYDSERRRSIGWGRAREGSELNRPRGVVVRQNVG